MYDRRFFDPRVEFNLAQGVSRRRVWTKTTTSSPNFVPRALESAASWHRRRTRRSRTLAPRRILPSTSGAQKTPSEPTWGQKCTFRKRPFPKPSKFRRRARSLCYFSHENLSESKKTPFSTPSGKGPGLTFGGLPVLRVGVVLKFAHFFRVRAHFAPKRPKCEKVHF